MKPAVALDFETLVELYYQPVFTFAVKLCGRLEQALDLTQHTFCQALNRQSYLGETRRVKIWLFTLLFREFLKRRQNESPSPCLRPHSASGSSPVLNAIAKMRKGLRDPLVLFYAKDFSFSQIADCLGISVETVLTLLAKGREELSLALLPSRTQNSRSSVSSSPRTRRSGSWRMAA